MKLILKISTLAITAFLIIPQSHAATPVPFNVEWVLTEMNGTAAEALTGGKMRNATLKLDAEKKQANGVSFVNRFSGKYELKDSALTFGEMVATRMASTEPKAMTAERDFHTMIKNVTGWRLTDGKLEMLQADNIVARFSDKATAGNTDAGKAKPDGHQLVADGNPAIPMQMCSTGILVKGKVMSVSDSQSKFTENSWTEVVVALSQVYRGEPKIGDEVKFSIEGWLGSEKEKAEFYRNAKTQDAEVIIPLRKVYNPFLKSFNNNYGGSTYLSSGEPLLATDTNIRHAAKAATIPIGWNFDGKEVISTWSAVDKAVFRMKDANAESERACGITGRPGFLTDGRLEMGVDLLKTAGREPDAAIFGISLTNPTDKPIKIESLRSSEGKILWNESILFVNYDQVWLPMSFVGFTENTEATVIQPGQTLKGEIPWTAQFSNDTLICLGSKSFSIYINESRNYESYLKDGRHPKPPFQLKIAKFSK